MPDDFQKQIDEIKIRNTRVEKDKAWEQSWTRRILIAILTYLVVVLFFYTAKLPDPFLNALVPVVGFLLSTLTVGAVKKIWSKG